MQGTQCELLKQNYPCAHLSAGQLLREETLNPESPHAALIEECLVSGKIVPVEISLALIRNAMEGTSGKSLIFLIDGFPRNFDNLEGWTQYMGDAAVVWGVLVYQCPLSILEERVLDRAKGSGRSDDNVESLRKRFSTFEGEAVPVIDALRLIKEETLLELVEIRGDQTLQDVWKDTQNCMNSFIANDILASNLQLLEAVATSDVGLYKNLCAVEMFASEEPSRVMAAHELGTHIGEISNARLEFLTGKKASLSYDRAIGNITVHETRIWSHQGAKGWRMIHFSRNAPE